MQNRSPGSAVAGFFIIVFLIIALIAAGAWLFSFHGVDQGTVAVVREGGIFDGRGIKEIRQPGSGAKPIGAFNHQDTLPITQRDLTEEAGQITVPTADGVNVVIDGQALFQLKTDPALVEKFYKAFGRRKWNGEDISSDEGWVNFLKIRMVPILYQSIRQTLGTYDCTSLNNTCIYVLNADTILASNDKQTQDEAAKKAKQVNVSQNLADAEEKITTAFKTNLIAGLGGEYFEGVRFQNLRVLFPGDIQTRVQAAQGKRAEVAEARLESQRKAAAAKGDADARVESARGERLSNEERAKGVEALARAYRRNPQQAQIEKIKALCGVDGNGTPKGCAGLQVLGSGSGQIINLK
jgi:hypothetical protein